jgi:hypothetical protein
MAMIAVMTPPYTEAIHGLTVTGCTAAIEVELVMAGYS